MRWRVQSEPGTQVGTIAAIKDVFMLHPTVEVNKVVKIVVI